MSFDIFPSSADRFARTASRTAARRLALAIGLAAFAAMLFAGAGISRAATVSDWNGLGTDIGVATNFTPNFTSGNDLRFFNTTFNSTAPTTDSAALTVGELLFSNAFDPGSAVTITASGPGSITLNGDNSATGINDTAVEAITLNVPITLGVNQTWINSSVNSTLTIQGSITNGADNLTILGNNATNISGNIIGSGAGSLTIGGGNSASVGTIVTLSGTNTYTGGTTINDGTLRINNASAIGTGTLTIGTQGTVFLDNTSGSPISLSSGNNNAQTWKAGFIFTGTNRLDMGTGAISMTASSVISVLNNSLTIGGEITSTSTLTKAGPGILVLNNGSNTFGATGVTLSGGTLDIGSGTALGASTSTFTITNTSGVNGGETSQIQPINAASFVNLLPVTVANTSGSAMTFSNNNPIAINSNFFFAGSNTNTNSDINLGTGTVTMNNSPSIVALGGTLTFGGTDTSNTTLQTSGAGQFVVTSANNAYTLNVGRFEGAYLNDGGTFTISGAGTLTNNNSANVYDNGTLTLDNSINGNQNYRLTAGAVGTGRGLSVNGNAVFNLIGNASTPTLEDSGTLSITQGNGSGGGQFVESSGMATVNLVSNGQSVQYTASSLGFNTGTVLFRGTNLGTIAISSTGSAGSATTIAFTTAPGLSGGAFAANQNTPLVGIISDAMGDSVIGGVDTYGLVTYDSTATTGVGLRLLNPSEYASTLTTNSNVLLNGGTTNAATSISVNSIMLSNGATLTGAASSNSGVYAAANGGANVLSVNSLPNTPVIEALGATTTLTVTTNLTGNGFLNLTGNGTIIMNGLEDQNGGALIVGGNVKIGVANWMGTVASPNFINPNGIAISGTLDLNGFSLVTPFMSNNTFGGAGTITNSSTTTPVTLTFQGSNLGGENNSFNNAPFVGNINDGGMVGGMAVTKVGVNPMILAGGGTYSGGLNVLQGSLVLGSDTAQGGNATVNLGDTSAPSVENAALLLGTPGLFGMPGLTKPATFGINIQAGNAGDATFGLDEGSSAGVQVTYNGAVTLGKNAYISGDYNETVAVGTTAAAGLTPGQLVGVGTNNGAHGSILVIGTGATFTGPGSLTQNGGVVQWTSPSNTGFEIPGGFGVILGNTQMILTNQLTPGTFSLYTTNGSTPGAITLSGNGLIQNAVTTGAANFTVVTPNFGKWIVNDPFVIGANGGSISVSTTTENNQANTAGANSSVAFTGSIRLGGTLLLNGTQNSQNNSTFTDGDALTTHFTGQITLTQTPGSASGLQYTSGLSNSVPINDIVDSVIVDGTGGEDNPLYLTGSPVTNSGATFNITGVSTYAGGTVINPALGIINVVGAGQSLGTPATTYALSGQLGTGNITILPGGKLRLNNSANLAAGASVVVTSGLLNSGFLDIAFNPATQAGLDVSQSSTGTLAIDSASFSTNLNQSTLTTSGTMFIGSLSAGTDSGTIVAGAGPGSGTYRLGGGDGTLTLSNSGAIATPGANLIVDQVGGFDQSGNPYGIQNGQGTVKFTAPQANLTGAITINGGMTASTTGVYSGILELAVPSGTAANVQPIGTGANNVTLIGGSLQFDPPVTANKNSLATIGNLIVNGGPSSLTTNNDGTGNNGQGPASGSTITINGTLGIVRNENATLFVGLSTTDPNNGGDPAFYVLGPTGQFNVTATQNQAANSLTGSGGTFFAVTNNSLAGPGTGTNPATAIGNFVPAGSISNGMATYGLAQTPGDGTNVAPWIMYNSSGQGGTFLAYTSAGFVPTIPTVDNVVGVLTFATNSQFVNTIASDVVFIQNPTATDASMTANHTVFAIESTKNTGTVNIQSTTTTGPITLTVTSGGISADEQNGNMNFGIAATPAAPTPNDGVNVQFGATGTAEAVLYVGSNNGTSSMTFLNQVTAGNLTKTGLGNLFLLNPSTNGVTSTLLPSANVISGNVTIDEGLIETGVNPNNAVLGIGELALGPIPTSTGSQGNSIILNGGGWMIQSDTSSTISHNILVGAAGGIFGGGTQSGQTKTYNGSIMDDPNLPSGVNAGPLTLSLRNGSTFTFAPTAFPVGTPNQWSGGTLIQGGGTAIVQNGVNFGTGSVEVFSPSTLTLQGSNNLSSTAALTVDLGATANLQFNGSVVIGSLNGGGSVVLGSSTGPTSATLRVGGNNASTTFSGPISQISGTTSSLSKVGTGSLTLTGTSSYAGTTTVTNGTLRFNGSLTGTGLVTVGDSANAGSTPILTGTGVITGAVNILGSSSPSAGAIAGTSGAELVLNGGLTLNNGSISNFALTALGVSNTNPLISTTGANSLTFPGGSTDTVNLSGTGALGTYDLLSYTNGAIPGGSFAIGTNSISGPFNYTLTPTASQLDLIISSAITLTWTNAGTSPSNPGVWDVGTTQNWATSLNAASTYADGDDVQFTDTNVLGPTTLSSPQNITISGTVNPGKVEFQNNAVSYSVGGGVIAGAAQLDLDATGSVTGTVTLTGANTYTGGTFITNGSLRLGASSSGGSNSSVTSGPVGTGSVTIGATGSNNASMYLAGTSGGPSLGNSIVVASGGSGTVTIGGQNTSGIDTFSGTITLGNGSSGQSLTISEPTGGELDLTGGILAGPTAAGITVNGGLVKLTNGSSTYAGTTIVSTGTLRVTNTSGSATGTGPVNVSSGAVLGGGAGGTTGAIGGLVTIAGSADLAPNGFTGTSSPGTVTNLTLNGGLTLSNSSHLDYILGTSGDLVTLGGTGQTLTLGTGVALNVTQAAGFGLGTYDLINYGTNTVAAGSDANLSTWTDPTHGTFQQPTFSDNATLHQIDLTLTQITASAAWNFAGNGNWSDITKWSPLGTYPNGAGQTATFDSGSINSPSSIAITNDINPTLGTLAFNNSTVSYTLSGGTITMNNNNTGAAVSVTAGNHSIASALALTDTSGTTFTVAGSSSLGISGGINNEGNLVTFSGAGNAMVSSAGISGAGGLTKAGTGMLTLSTANSYSGLTTVNAGTLRILGSLTYTSGTVNVGGTSASEVNTNTVVPAGGTPSLGGSGMIDGSVEVFGNTGGSHPGHLAPSGFNGLSPSVLNIGGNLTLDTGAVLDFNLFSPDSSATSGPVTASNANDYVAVGGSLSLNGGTLNINDPHGLSTGTYVLATYGSGSPIASGWTANLTTPAAGLNLNFSTANAGQFDLIVTTGSGSAIWTSTGAGASPSDYGTASNWTPGTVPNGVGQTATFGAGAQFMVSINSSYTLGQLNFNNGGNSGAPTAYLLSGNGNLTLNNSGSGASVNVSSGSLAPELGANVTLTLADASLTTTFNIASGSSLVVGGAIGQSGSGQSIVLSGGGTLELASPNTYTGSTTINSGTLQIDSGASIAHTSSVSIGAGGTLQLAGTTGALPSTVNIATHGTGSNGDGALVLTGAATETVGTISGDTHQITDGSQQVTVYSGNTTVGDGNNSASLTATQILQNTLTINAGSTVTIAPSGSGIPTDAVATASSVATSDSAADGDSSSDSSSDPFTAIQEAIASGSISSAKGQQLENRIAAIERLATTDPGLDVSLLEDRVLAALPSTSVWSSSGTSPLLDSGSGLLAVDSSTFGSSSGSSLGGSAAFAPAAAFGGSPAAVPEPSTLLLAALGGIGILIALRRRTICCEQ